MKKFTVNDTRHNENYLLRNTDKNDSGRLETKTNEYCQEKNQKKNWCVVEFNGSRQTKLFTRSQWND